MKKKLMALALTAVMAVGSVASVSASVRVGVGAGISNNRKTVSAYTQVVGGNVADYKATVQVTATTSTGKTFNFATVADKGTDGVVCAKFSYTLSPKSIELISVPSCSFIRMSSTHLVYYRSKLVFKKYLEPKYLQTEYFETI